MVGLDTSHCPAFANLLNNPDNPHHVPGGRVVVAYPGGSPSLAQSYTRVKDFTERVRSEFGVEIVDSIKAVAESSDAILLESVDGRQHLEQFAELAPYGKPVFIDKPITTSTDDARALYSLAEKHGTPVYSTSSLRFAAGIAELGAGEEILGCEVYGPNAILDDFPGLFWYGIHSAEILYAKMGRGCTRVQVFSTEKADVVAGEWEDGRVGTIYGYRLPKLSSFGATVMTPAGVFHAEAGKTPPYYAPLLESVITFFRTGVSPVPKEVTLEIVRFLEAANESREHGGVVTL